VDTLAIRTGAAGPSALPSAATIDAERIHHEYGAM
jgi:hypothetical protein